MMNSIYLNVSWRNILRNKSASYINIGGLAVGMTVSFMLLLYVYNEYSFDKLHANSERIYQVFKNQLNNGTIKTTSFWYIIRQWLSKYFYHTSLHAWVFALTMIISLIICLVAVGWQAVKAASINPIKNLKSE